MTALSGKHAPDKKLYLEGVAALDLEALSVRWECTSHPELSLSSANVSSTYESISKSDCESPCTSNLVILANVLTPGVTYSFTLFSTIDGVEDGEEGYGSIDVEVNQP